MPYNPFNWYWQADDGRVFSSARAMVVDKADTAFTAFAAALGYVPAWPRDDAGVQTNAALQAVLAPYRLFIDIAALKASLCADIDAQAETERGKYITLGAGQTGVYLLKQTQAVQAIAAASAAPPMTADQGKQAYLLLAAEIGITVDPSTKQPAVDVFGVARAVIAVLNVWLPIAASIEAVRLNTKAAINAAATPAAAQAAHDAVAWPAPS